MVLQTVKDIGIDPKYLNIEINLLKIDKEFIHELFENNESKSITGTIISLAHELGIGVVAEGVETEDQYEFLASSKCDFMQGYFICKPVAEEEILEFLEDNYKV